LPTKACDWTIGFGDRNRNAKRILAEKTLAVSTGTGKGVRRFFTNAFLKTRFKQIDHVR
jgi:hypothetical protein